MTVDRNGVKIHVGDIVMLPCRIMGVEESGRLNLLVESLTSVGDRVNTQLLLNSTQVILEEALGDSALDIDVSEAIKQDSGILKKGRG